MTNAELLAKIKAEIDKLYGEYKGKFHQCGDQYHLGLIDGLDMAERVLDTLESEKTISPWKKIHTYTEELHEGDMEKMLLELSVGKGEKRTKTALPDRIVDILESEKPMELEEEDLKKELHDFIMEFGPAATFDKCASRFYDLGCRRTAEKFDEIEYNRQRVEECVPNDLEEAAEKHSCYDEDCEGAWYEPIVRNAFITGAKWQKQHDAELIEIAYNDGITIGMTKQKEQMLKEAEECELYWDGYFLAIDLNMTALGYSEGDKVRIIIVKE